MGISDLQIEQQAFPVLSTSQIDLLRPFGEIRSTQVGEVLFEVGDLSYHLVVVLEGQTEVVERSEGIDRGIKTSGPGEFHGELGLLTGQTVFAACVVREPGSVLLVPPTQVQEVIATIPELSDVLVPALAARRQILMRSAAATLTIVGSETSPEVLRLQEFVDRNRIPHRQLSPADPAAAELLAPFGGTEPGAVRVIVRGQRVLDLPSNLELAQAIGGLVDLTVHQEEPADLIVVGTGPAGLATAVYGASEGLSTVAVDDVAIGGQAGTSSRIENYLGFPAGISGGELAFRAEVQAIKFGARITVPRRALALEQRDGVYVVRLDDGTVLRGRSVVVATGARYRRLDLPRQDDFEGAGIYYAATDLEARFCRDAEVIVVGGGNSAGQAAMFLAGYARRVHLVHRQPNLSGGMSQYLVVRLERSPNVHLHLSSQIRELRGQEQLSSVVVANGVGEIEEIGTRALFVMIGADPRTDWLQGTLELDARGFIVTGQLRHESESGTIESPFQTSLPGVFAVGDVRSGSVKRVASAVGEGSVVVQAVHRSLTE